MMIAALWVIALSLRAIQAASIAPANVAAATNAAASQTARGIPTGATTNAPQQAALSRLTDLLIQKQYLELDGALKASLDIPAVQRAFFEGVLANRENRITDSLRELELALADKASPLASNLQTIALRTLADSYAKSFRYGDAADTYARLLGTKDSSLSEAEEKDVDGNRLTMELLRNAPPQTVVFHGAFRIPTKKNALGLAEVQVTVGGQQQSWVLDTGANLSLVTASEARRMGLTVSQGTTPLAGLGGSLVSAHAAVIPEVRVGTAALHHVAVLVVEDKDFYVPEVKFHFRAILGYPALSALSSITLYNDGGFGARTAPEPEKLRGSQMMMEALAPLVAVTIGSTRQLFLLDTGTDRTYFTERYWEEHKSDFAGQQPHTLGIDGVGESQQIPAYIAKSVAITAGGIRVTLKDVGILTKPTGKGADYFYGILGQDVLKLFNSCTLDFRDMRYICSRISATAHHSDADKDNDDD